MYIYINVYVGVCLSICGDSVVQPSPLFVSDRLKVCHVLSHVLGKKVGVTTNIKKPTRTEGKTGRAEGGGRQKLGKAGSQRQNRIPMGRHMIYRGLISIIGLRTHKSVIYAGGLFRSLSPAPGQ